MAALSQDVEADLRRENARLQADLRAARDRQNASAEILRTIAGVSGDAERSLHQIAETTARLFGASSVTIRIASGDGWGQIINVGAGAKRIGAEVRADQLRIGGRNLPGTVVHENRQIHIPDINNVDPEIADWPGLPPARAAGSRTIAGTPLRREGKAIGALIVHRDRLEPFTAEELALQQSFADQAVIAIENARLFEESQEALERQTATAEILKVIAGSPSDVQPVFEAIAENAKRLSGGHSSTVTRVIGDMIYLAAFTAGSEAGNKEVQSSFPTPLSSSGIHSRVARAGEIAFRTDMESELDVTPAMKELARARGYRSILVVPMLRDGISIGTISVTRRDPGPFADNVVNLLRTFADQAVIAVENVRLFNETKEALARQTATSDILRVISGSPTDVQPVFDAIVLTAARLLRCDRAFIQRCDGAAFWTVASSGQDGPLPISQSSKTPIDPDANFPSRAITSKTTLHLPDWSAIDLPDYERRIHETLGINSALFIPLLREGECIGLLAIAGKQAGMFGESEITLAESFRDQALIAIENTRLFNETKEALERQNASAEILRTIASTPGDAGRSLKQIAETSARLFGAPSVSIQLVEDGKWADAYRLGDSAQRIRAAVPLANIPVGGRNMPGTVAGENRQIHIPDLDHLDPSMSDWPGLPHARAAGTRTMCGTPLRREGKAIGALIVYRDRLLPFTEEELALQQSFADQAVIAIENARLFNETQEALERQTATAEILKVIASSPSDVQPVFDVIVERAVRLCGGRMGRVYRYDGGVIQMVAGHGLSAPGLGKVQQVFPRPATDDTIAGQVMLSHRPYFVTDIQHDDTVPPLSRQMIEALGTRSQVTVPMLRTGEAIGAITVGWADPGVFGDQQVSLLQTFADQAVIAIENVRLFNETREALERQTATADILKVIASSPNDVKPVFEAIAESSKRLLGGFSAAVFRFVDGVAHVAAFTPTNPAADEVLQATFPRPVTEFRPFELAQAGEIVQVTDTETEPDARMKDVARARGFRSVLNAPLMSRGEPIGVITVTRKEPGSFADHHVQLLRTFADQAVIAIENARLFNETREALERQTATADILKVIASSPNDVKPVFEAIATSSNRLIGGFSTAVLRFIGDELHLAAFTPTNAAADEALKASFPGPISEFPPFMLVRNGETAQITDTEAEGVPPVNRNLARLRGYRSMLFTPLMSSGTPIGLISVTRKEPGTFAAHHMQLVRTFADQAVIAIENVRLFDEVQAKTRDLAEALTYQTGSSNILGVIASSPTDVGPVLKAIVESACELCDAQDAVVTLREGNDLRYAAHHGSIPVGFERRPISRSWVTGRAVVDKAPVHVRDLFSGEGDEFPEAQALSRSHGIQTLLSVPLLKENESIGAILLRRVEVHPFTDKQIALLQTFADQAVIAIGNVRLFDEVQARTRDLSESLEQQTATSEVLEIISSSPGELDPVFQKMLENATRVCGANFGTMSLYDGDLFRNVALYNTPEQFAEDLREPIRPHPKSGLATVARTHQAIQIEDLRTQQPYLEGDRAVIAMSDLAGARTIVIVPMLRENELVGTIAIYRREVRPFTEKQVDLVANFAKQAVIAIENTRLLKELRERTDDLSESLQQQTATADVLKVISASPGELEPVFQAMLENAVRLCEAKFAMLFLYDEEKNEFRAVGRWNLPPAWSEFLGKNQIRADPRVPLGRVAMSKQPVQIADVLVDQAYIDRYPGMVAVGELGGARTLLQVPMLKENELVGTIGIYRQEVRPFSDKQIELVTNFAAQAVIAIENTRLLKELHRRTDDLSESLQQQTATAEVLKVISASPGELEPVFQAMLENAVRLCEAKFAMLFSFEREENEFRAIGKWNLPPAYSEFLGKNPLRADPRVPLGRVAATKQPVQVADIVTDPAYVDRYHPGIVAVAELGGARTLLQVPMLKDNELVGAIGIYRQEVRPFTDKQIALVQNFAAQAVIAIENARLLNELRQRTSDLTESLNELRTAQDRLVQTEKLASLGQLTAGIAHEIKNPLNFVNNFSALSAELTDELNDVLKSASLSGNVREEVDELTGLLKDNLGKVVQHGRRADSIVKNMLLHSREGSGEHRPADINALVDESLNLAYHGARAEKPQFNVTLQRNFDPNAGMIEAFPQEITRVFLNLISNGFYAVTKRKADNGGTGFEPVVSATTKDRGDQVEIRIRDNGTGIPAEVKEKMFNPFFTTKPAGEGTGLGLSMSHDIIVKQHGGTIDVDTAPGQFTEFRIVLPRTRIFSSKSGG